MMAKNSTPIKATLTYTPNRILELSGDDAWELAWHIVHNGLHFDRGSYQFVINGEPVVLCQDGEIEREANGE